MFMCFKIKKQIFELFLKIQILNSKHIKYFFKKIIFFLTYIALFYIAFVGKKTKFIPKNYISEERKTLIDNFYNLIDIKNLNNPFNQSMILDGKENIINALFGASNKNVSDPFEGVVFKCDLRFGNLIVILDKVLFYFELFGLKKLALDKNDFWFLNNNIKSIHIQKPNITIEIKDKNKVDPNKALKIEIMFLYFYKYRPIVKIGYIRDEIMKNLIKIDLSQDYLFIHIRSGDIFDHLIHYPYAQPPLCFYRKILENFKFSRIYLITSKERNNPVIGKLIKLYPNIILKKNSLKVDISLLANAYNIVGSISSFVNSIIRLNNNLKYLWDYNIYQNMEKIRQLHYDLYKYPHNNFTIFRMNPSNYYRSYMYNWRIAPRQLKLMIREKCINNFVIIKREE